MLNDLLPYILTLNNLSLLQRMSCGNRATGLIATSSLNDINEIRAEIIGTVCTSCKKRPPDQPIRMLCVTRLAKLGDVSTHNLTTFPKFLSHNFIFHYCMPIIFCTLFTVYLALKYKLQNGNILF